MEVPQCFNCIHKIKGGPKCLAFASSRIPLEIIMGKFTHDHIHPDQQADFLFEPKHVYELADPIIKKDKK